MVDRTDDLEFDSGDLEDASTTRVQQFHDVGSDRMHRLIEDRLERYLETRRRSSSESDRLVLDPEIRSERPKQRSETDNEPGRLSARIETTERSSRLFGYKPYGPHGAILVIIGLLAAFPTIFVSLLLSLVGYYLYRVEREESLPLKQWLAIDVLVTETQATDPAGDSVANDFEDSSVTVTVSVDPVVGIDIERLSELSWTQRKAMVTKVTAWSEQILETGSPKRTEEDVFFEYMTMWLKRKSESDVETIESTQSRLLRDSTARRTYADLVSDADERNDRSEEERLSDRSEGEQIINALLEPIAAD